MIKPVRTYKIEVIAGQRHHRKGWKMKTWETSHTNMTDLLDEVAGTVTLDKCGYININIDEIGIEWPT